MSGGNQSCGTTRQQRCLSIGLCLSNEVSNYCVIEAIIIIVIVIRTKAAPTTTTRWMWTDKRATPLFRVESLRTLSVDLVTVGRRRRHLGA